MRRFAAAIPLFANRREKWGVAARLPLEFLVEIHQLLAEINHCKSIKRTELSAIPGVESNS